MTSWYIFVIRHVYIRIQVNTFSQSKYMGWKAVSAYIMDLHMLRIRVIDEEMMLEILYISLRFVNHNLTAFQFCNGYWTGTCTLQGKACYITIGMWMYSWIKIPIRYIIFVFIFIFAGYCIHGSPSLKGLMPMLPRTHVNIKPLTKSSVPYILDILWRWSTWNRHTDLYTLSPRSIVLLACDGGSLVMRMPPWCVTPDYHLDLANHPLFLTGLLKLLFVPWTPRGMVLWLIWMT